MTDDPWSARQRAAAVQIGWPIEQVAAAIREAPACLLQRAQAGEIQAIGLGGIVVVPYRQLVQLGLI